LPPRGLARLDDQPHAQDIERAARQAQPPQANPVLLGRDEHIDAELGGARVEP
jgi:hypothetical protein